MISIVGIFLHIFKYCQVCGQFGGDTPKSALVTDLAWARFYFHPVVVVLQQRGGRVACREGFFIVAPSEPAPPYIFNQRIQYLIFLGENATRNLHFRRRNLRQQQQSAYIFDRY